MYLQIFYNCRPIPLENESDEEIRYENETSQSHSSEQEDRGSLRLFQPDSDRHIYTNLNYEHFASLRRNLPSSSQSDQSPGVVSKNKKRVNFSNKDKDEIMEMVEFG